MPILHKEPSLYPASLFAAPVEEQPWHVVHVRSRHEKLVARVLARFERPYYLPQIDKSVQRSGRVFHSHLPLFSGYIFIRDLEPTRQVLWSTDAIVRVITVPDQQQLDFELRQLHQLQCAGAILTPVSGIDVGHQVRIVEGSFSGYTGVVIRSGEGERLVISVSAVNRSILVELPVAGVARVHRGERIALM